MGVPVTVGRRQSKRAAQSEQPACQGGFDGSEHRRRRALRREPRPARVASIINGSR
jgi:hypothetical protein